LCASFAWIAATLSVPPPEECVGEIGDYVWLDDGDGCQEDDAGIADVEVCIYAGCSSAMDPIACTFTDVDGFYLFTGLECGQDYEIKFTRPDGLVETEANSCPDPDNNDDTRDSDCVEGERVCVSLGEDTIVQDLTIDCGYVPMVTGITRTLGYWKNHPTVIDGSFDGPNGFPSLLPLVFCGDDIVEACDAVRFLRTRGGGIRNFKRQGMAALLNCEAFGCFSDISELIQEGSAACATGADFDFGAAAEILDAFNNSGDDLDLPFQSPPALPRFCR
jgi:hypothetical protein